MDEVEKVKRKKFKKSVRGTVVKKTVQTLLNELEEKTGLNKADVAHWMECSPGAVSKIAKNDKFRKRIKSVCRDLKLLWEYQERPLFGLD
jgi:predicted transcriptional regulator